MNPSQSNGLEICLGSIAEMTDGDVHKATEYYSKQNKIGYVRFRDVVGKVPNYKEVFIDEEDIDILMITFFMQTLPLVFLFKCKLLIIVFIFLFSY